MHGGLVGSQRGSEDDVEERVEVQGSPSMVWVLIQAGLIPLPAILSNSSWSLFSSTLQCTTSGQRGVLDGCRNTVPSVVGLPVATGIPAPFSGTHCPPGSPVSFGW